MAKTSVKHVMEMEHGGESWVGQWVSVLHSASSDKQQESADRWLLVFKKDGEHLIPFSGEDSVEIRNLLSAKRVAELQEEYNIYPDKEETLQDKLNLAEALIKRGWDKDWLCQKDLSLLYMQNIATIMNITYRETMLLLHLLGQQQKAGLNGAIIIPWEEEQKTYLYWEEKTGHKLLLMGDFGNWSCSACRQWGEDTENASEFPCKTPTRDGAAN